MQGVVDRLGSGEHGDGLAEGHRGSRIGSPRTSMLESRLRGEQVAMG